MRRTIKNVISFLLSAVMCLAMIGDMPKFTNQINVITADAAGIDNITARADYLYNLTWTSQANMNGYINSSGQVTKTYAKGQSYRIPYGQPVGSNGFIGYNISIDNFIEATKSASNPFYTKRSGGTSGSMNSNYYSMDCSTFVSYCWGLSSRYTTSTWSSVDATNLGKCTSANVGKIQQGDAINLAGSHIVLVSRVNSNGTYEITEETPPEVKRTTYSASDLVKNYSSYTIYRYNKRDSVAPPPNASSSSFPGEEDNSYSVPISVTASKKINTYDGNGNLESNRWIDAGDACTIDKVYKNGFVHVGYPTSSGTRWAYAKKDDFDLKSSSHSPIGNVEYAAGGAGTITIRGWAQDQDDERRPVEINVYKDSLSLGNGLKGGIIANIDRGDGTHTGFDATFSVGNTGTYHILVFALNLPNTGGNDWTLIGEMDVVVSVSGEIVDLGNNFDASIKSLQSSKYIITNTDANVFLFKNPVGYSEKYWNFERQSDGSYRIKAYCNGWYMDVDGALDESGRNIQSWPDNGGGSAQRWFIFSCGNNYILRPACSSSRVLDVYNGETGDGTNVIISDYNGGDSQQVIIEKTQRAAIENFGDNFDAMITNPDSGKYVTASANNDNVILYDSTAYASKRIWNFARQSDNSYRITSYFNSKCLDVEKGNDENSTNICTYAANDNANQRWYIVKNGSSYRLMPACSNSRSLDIAGGKLNNADNIQLWDNNDTSAQSFSIEKITDTTAPTISSVKISDITKDDYKVTITVSDNVGIVKVAVPTWTQANGQDDLFAEWDKTALATQTSNNTWTYNVKVSDHNNERGVYYTDVYAWDFNGNSDAWRGENQKRTTIKVGMYNLTVDPNGGAMKDESGNQTTKAVKITKNQLVYNGTNYYSLTWTIPTRAGYSFMGFYSAPTGGTKIYGAYGKCINEGKYFKNNLYQQTADLTVYAQWKAESVAGDVDADGKLSVSDLVLLQKWILGVPDTNLANWENADLCKDGVLDVFDLCLMRKMLIYAKIAE